VIFNKNVYSPSNLSLSFLKRLRLVSFLRTQSSVDYNETMREIPRIQTRRDVSDISFLNELCHVEAFIEKDKSIHVDLSLCNSCADCSFGNDYQIEMIPLKKSEMSLKDLALSRDD
jgi:MinD superfamily P-loop ATPase